MKNEMIKRTRWLCLLLFTCCTCFNVSAQQKISVQLKNASIRSVFGEIKKQVDVGFMYSNTAISEVPKKDYSFQQSDIATVLNYALQGTDLTFEIENNKNIIIKRKKVSSSDAIGRVIDASGEPIVGATVQEQGVDGHGTVTDLEGQFSLKLKVLP